MMRRVVIESPFRATETYSAAQFAAYLDACLSDAINRGEAPFASHAIYPRVLNDANPVDRHQGIAMGLEWGSAADLVAVYSDFGVSEGMDEAIRFYASRNVPVEWRRIDQQAFDRIRKLRE